MIDEPFADRRNISFEQAEGLARLPTQLKFGHLSPELRASLYYPIHDHIKNDDGAGRSRSFLGDRWRTILEQHWSFVQHKMVDRFTGGTEHNLALLSAMFERENYARVLGFVEFVLRNPNRPAGFASQVNQALTNARAAYRIIDGDTVVPIASGAEQATIKAAFADMAKSEFDGAREHLKEAGRRLTAGDFAASVRESVHAVESVARIIASSNSLSGALDKIESHAAIHVALKRGFNAIYGYTSNEQGIRHALLEDAKANVDEATALFMMGACASFVSYLISKARAADLLPKPAKGK